MGSFQRLQLPKVRAGFRRVSYAFSLTFGLSSMSYSSIHFRRMKVYKEVPQLWYGSLFIVSLGLAIGMAYVGMNTLPWWSVLLFTVIGESLTLRDLIPLHVLFNSVHSRCHPWFHICCDRIPALHRRFCPSHCCRWFFCINGSGQH
jgi:hypothetical protein